MPSLFLFYGFYGNDFMDKRLPLLWSLLGV
jgi:hypothetical protein